MISVMVPAFNEEKNLANTIESILNGWRSAGDLTIEIIIVDDGSTDKTGEIIADYKKKYDFIRSIRHDRNLGYGTNLKDAVRIAQYPKLMLVPGDNDFRTELIEKLFRNSDKADLILVYYINRERRGRKRNIMSTVFNTIYMTTFNIFVQYVNGGVIYPIAKLQSMDIKASRFSIIAELVVKTMRSGSTYHEIADYMQTGLEGSSSFSFKNLYEVVSTFILLIIEIYITKKEEYNKMSQRVY